MAVVQRGGDVVVGEADVGNQRTASCLRGRAAKKKSPCPARSSMGVAYWSLLSAITSQHPKGTRPERDSYAVTLVEFFFASSEKQHI